MYVCKCVCERVCVRVYICVSMSIYKFFNKFIAGITTSEPIAHIKPTEYCNIVMPVAGTHFSGHITSQ